MLVFLSYLVAALAFVGMLAVVGWPLATALRAWDIALPAPLVGICVVPIFSWYWVYFTGEGLKVGIWILVGASVVLCAVLAVGRRTDLAVRSAVVHAVAVAVAAVVVCLAVFRAALATPYLTTFSTGNNDASAWLSHAQHLLDAGLRVGTAFSGYDFPKSFELEATFGSVSLLASAAAITGLPTWQVGGFVICAFVALVMLALSTLVQRVACVGPVAATAVAAAATAPALFLYSSANFFFGHVVVLAIIPVVALLAFELTQRSSFAETAPVVIALAVAVAMIVSSYAPATLTLPVLFAAAGTATVTGPPRLKRMGRFVTGVAASILLAVALVPQLALWALHRLQLLSGGKWGWELSTFLPAELLGFTAGILEPPSVLEWLASGLILGLVAYVSFRQRKTEDFAVPGFWLVVGILLSYALMTWHFGPSHYNAWKWIAYFQPLLCATVYSVMALGIKGWLSSRRPDASVRRSYPRAVGCVGALAALLAVLNSQQTFTTQPEAATIGFGTGDAPMFQTVPSSIEAFPTVASRAGIREVNIDLPPHWETVWAWYGLRNMRTYRLQPSWLPQQKPRAHWDLQRVDSGPTASGQRVVPIDRTYRFAERSADLPSEGKTGLDSDLTLIGQHVTGGVRTVRVEAKNTGTRCWLPVEAPKPVRGGVRLQAIVLGVDSVVTKQRQKSKPLRTASCVGHDWSTELTLRVPRSTQRLLRLQLVAAGVGPFGEILEVQPGTSVGASQPR